MSDERIAVTGGTGFIGSQVVNQLLSKGKRVRVLARKGIARADVDIFICDILKRESMAGAFSGCDAVLHFAAQIPQANVPDYLFAEVNVEGTRNVVEEALKCGVRRVVMASTWCVYGAPSYLPIDEAHPTVPDGAYGESKLAAEAILRDCCEAHGAAHCALRYSNVYGPEASQRGAILRFIESVAAGQPPVVFGDGSQVVDYVYVSDAAEAALLALDNAASGVLNIGAGKGPTIADIARIVADACGRPEITPVIQNGAAQASRYLDVSLAKRDIGFAAKTTIEKGVRMTAEWHEKTRKHSSRNIRF